MKKILNESQKRALVLEREKAILENFTKTFNKIKRIDENELNVNMRNIKNQAFNFANSPEMGEFVNQILSKANPQDIQQLKNVVGGVNEGGIYENEMSSFLNIANKAQSVLTEDVEVSDLDKLVGKVMQKFGVANIMSMGTLPTLVAMAIDHFGGPNFMQMLSNAVGGSGAAVGLSVVASLIGGGLIWRIGKAISGEEVNGNTPLFEMTDKEYDEMMRAQDTPEAVMKSFYQAISKEGLPNDEMFYLGGNNSMGSAKALEDAKFRMDVIQAFRNRSLNDKINGTLAINIAKHTDNPEVLKALLQITYELFSKAKFPM